MKHNLKNNHIELSSRLTDSKPLCYYPFSMVTSFKIYMGTENRDALIFTKISQIPLILNRIRKYNVILFVEID